MTEYKGRIMKAETLPPTHDDGQVSTHQVAINGQSVALEPLTVVMGPQLGAMAYVDDDAMLEAASKKATALKRIVDAQKLTVRLQGKEYVKCEGWVTLAALSGLIPTIVGTHALEDGRYTAVAELRTHGGQVLARADAECGSEDDGQWAKRPAYARRSMAQTRAVGKVCHISLSWVMTLAGYAPTPAEEMDGIFEAEPVVDTKLADCIQTMRRRAASVAALHEGLTDHSGDGLREAATAWFELDDDEKKALWIAPSKGGPFTTREREILKSAEFRQLYYGNDVE